jgi:phosphoribosylglycinamide formyltransferase-1
MKKIVIFASGSGTNAQNIIEYFNKTVEKKVTCVYSNKKDAKVLDRAKKYGVPVVVFNRSEFYETSRILNLLLEEQPDLIVLAGFLWLVPENIIKNFPNRIINIHPALLPKYGGKGMYGMNVHRTVLENGEQESGITIHYVNEVYDAGDIIFQTTCQIDQNDTPELLAEKVHELEYRYFPGVVDKLLDSVE